MQDFKNELNAAIGATCHLSLIEEAVFHRIIALYYLNDGRVIYNIESISERLRLEDYLHEVLRKVIGEFFVVSSDDSDTEGEFYEYIVNKEADRKISYMKEKSGDPL